MVKIAPKKVVYLWGAGATHAEAQRLGSTISLLMRDNPDFGEGITNRIFKRAGSRVETAYGSGTPGQEVDIEKLISLLSASGNDQHSILAEKLRRAYFTELKVSLSKAKVLNEPQLATQLFELHHNATFRNEVETLCGIITTNHDGLLQLASQRVFGGVNIGFDFESQTFQLGGSDVPPILQLHGSFTWDFGLPIKIGKLTLQSKYDDTVWIPPTILKESKMYPFNKLAAFAYELLSQRCDVLRVIGTSLTQNDWNILSIIFNAQRHREVTKGHAFSIELIMPQESGEYISKECAYLKNMRTIAYLTDGDFSEYKDEKLKIPPESDLANPFWYWLNEKSNFHKNKGDLAENRQIDSGNSARAVA